MEEIIYSNVQSKSGLDYYVVCSARTAINSRVVAGSNYEVVYYPTVPTFPQPIRTTGCYFIFKLLTFMKIIWSYNSY